MAVDPVIVATQIAWGGASGAGPSVLSKAGAETIRQYVDDIRDKLDDPNHGWDSDGGKRLRLSLPVAGGLVGGNAAARGSGVIEPEDVEVGIAYLETGTRLCRDS